MEERQEIKEFVQFLEIEEKSLDDVIKYLNELKKNLNPKWKYTIEMEYGGDEDVIDVGLSLFVTRPEDDEEFNIREKFEEKAKQYQKQKDAELKTLEERIKVKL